jgi:RNA polymerase sigma factor (sigma-70 family)
MAMGASDKRRPGFGGAGVEARYVFRESVIGGDELCKRIEAAVHEEAVSRILDEAIRVAIREAALAEAASGAFREKTVEDFDARVREIAREKGSVRLELAVSAYQGFVKLLDDFKPDVERILSKFLLGGERKEDRDDVRQIVRFELWCLFVKGRLAPGMPGVRNVIRRMTTFRALDFWRTHGELPRGKYQEWKRLRDQLEELKRNAASEPGTRAGRQDAAASCRHGIQDIKRELTAINQNSRATASLDSVPPGGADGESSLTLGEVLPDKRAIDSRQACCTSEARTLLDQALGTLSARSEWLLRKLFWEGISQADLERELGVSKATISRWKTAAFAKLIRNPTLRKTQKDGYR